MKWIFIALLSAASSMVTFDAGTPPHLQLVDGIPLDILLSPKMAANSSISIQLAVAGNTKVEAAVTNLVDKDVWIHRSLSFFDTAPSEGTWMVVRDGKFLG
jgi:hypothetical protein